LQSEKLKIGYFVPEFPGQTHGFFWREIKHLEALGANVRIISSSRPNGTAEHAFTVVAKSRTRYLIDLRLREAFLWLRTAALAASLLARGVTPRLTNAGEKRLKILMLFVFAARLKLICDAEGIRHIHGHSCADVAYLLALSKIAGGPDYSLSLHGDLSVYGLGHDFKFAGAKFVACVTEALCRQIKDEVKAWQGEPKLVRMGIEPPCVENLRDWSPAKALKLVTVSRLNPMKGHKHAIAAVRALVDEGFDITYDIIGEGEYHEEIQRQIVDAKLETQVRLVGPVANDSVVSRLMEYDAFLLPSVGLGEAAPVAVMEAMSVGMPVLCSIIGGTPEMIVHGRTGFLFPQADVDAIASIVRELALAPELRDRIGRKGQEYALDNFLSSVSASKLFDLMTSPAS
jgi:colanic acid/amylovoran biosynthesis glycosyltransferase